MLWGRGKGARRRRLPRRKDAPHGPSSGPALPEPQQRRATCAPQLPAPQLWVSRISDTGAGPALIPWSPRALPGAGLAHGPRSPRRLLGHAWPQGLLPVVAARPHRPGIPYSTTCVDAAVTPAQGCAFPIPLPNSLHREIYKVLQTGF